jgi:virulence-associated protein VagC
MNRLTMDEFRRNASRALRKLPFELTLNGEVVAIVTEPAAIITESMACVTEPVATVTEASQIPQRKPVRPPIRPFSPVPKPQRKRA